MFGISWRADRCGDAAGRIGETSLKRGAFLDQGNTQGGGSLLLDAQHQLRQPLHVISLLIAELRQDPAVEEREAIIADLQYAVDLSKTWLDSLADLEKAQQGLLDMQIQDLPLQQVFARLQDDFAPHFAGLGLDFRIVPTSAVVRADPVLLRHLMALLLDNAGKFTREGKVLLGCRHDGAHWRLELHDSGLGVAEDELHRLNEPFFRLENEVRPRERGLGLGLTYADRLADLAGDELTVTSKLGRGSCFSLTLRRATPLPADGVMPTAESVMPADPLEGAKVLILDGPDAVELQRSLESWGAKPRVQADLAAGLGDAPDMVIADRGTFESGDGWGLLRQFAAGFAPVVVLVTDSPPEGAGQTPGAAHFLTRPVKPARLRSLCHYALTRR